MTKENVIMVRRGGRGRLVVLTFLFLLAITILVGCTKEKAPEPKGFGCEIYDKVPGDTGKTLAVNFENKIKLIGITVKKQSKNQLEVSYYWQLIGNLDRFKNVYVHFADASNNVLFQNDHEFCPKKPLEELKNKFIKETFLINVPDSAKGKEVTIKLGIYVPEPNGPRLKIESAGDAAVDEKNTRVTVEKVSL